MPFLFLKESLQLEHKAKQLPTSPKQPCCKALTVYIFTEQELKQNITCLVMLTHDRFFSKQASRLLPMSNKNKDCFQEIEKS